MNLRIPRNALNFLTRGGTASFSKGSVLHGVVVSHCIQYLAGRRRAVPWAGSSCAEGGDRLQHEAGLLYVIE